MTQSFESPTPAGELAVFRAEVPTAAAPERVHAVLRDVRAHLVWAGRRSTMKSFRLLELDAPAGPAVAGTRFTSRGANNNGTFVDSSVVTDVSPYVFAFETDSLLERRHGADLRVGFSHRYDVQRVPGGGTVVRYACRVHDGSYVPYWLQPGVRRLTKAMVSRMMTRQLRNLVALAEERPATVAAS
jgi:hypothetical protein